MTVVIAILMYNKNANGLTHRGQYECVGDGNLNNIFTDYSVPRH